LGNNDIFYFNVSTVVMSYKERVVYVNYGQSCDPDKFYYLQIFV